MTSTHYDRIMLVEDDRAWAALTREAFLEVAPDVRLEIVAEGDLAITRLREPDAPPVVLLDLNMPGTDGREVLRALRELPGTGQRRVVVLSASVSGVDRALAEELGAAAYVNKPTTFAALCRMATAIAEDQLDDLDRSNPPARTTNPDQSEAPTITSLQVAFIGGHDPSVRGRLVAAGFDVRVAASVDDLPPVIEQGADCVVVDLDGPGARRNEVVRGASSAAGAVPVIAIVGATSEAAELATLAAGAADVVAAEDATQEVLRRTIRFAVERAALGPALARQQRFLDAVVDNVDAAIVACDAEGRLQIVNAAAAALHGRPADPRIGPEAWAEAYGIVDPDTGRRLRDEEVPLARALAGEVVNDVEVGTIDAAGEVHRCLVRAQPLLAADGKSLGAVVVFHDVTEQRRLESALAHQALHDPLTGLPNRRLALDRLRHAIDRGARGGDATAVLYVDLDGFKTLNDTAGHAAGDTLLRTVADRLANAVRPGDTVARIGGDEFLVIAESVSDGEQALALADRIHAALSVAAPLPDGIDAPTCSIGIALTHSSTDIDGVLQDADAAMYTAKRSGPGRTHRVSDPPLGLVG